MWLTVHLKEEKEEKNQRDRLRDYSQSVFFYKKTMGYTRVVVDFSPIACVSVCLHLDGCNN